MKLAILAALALTGCATLDFNCKSDGRIDVFDSAVVNKCLDNSAPTVTFRAKHIYGCGIEPKPVIAPVRVIEGTVVP